MHAGMKRPQGENVGIFTGAGVSLSKPAQLPSAWHLVDRILALCDSAAESTLGRSLPSRLRETTAEWGLEYIVSRLRGTIGSIALEVLSTLLVDLPNEEHLLLALHHAAGGTQVTVNLDEGVEYAYGLLSGTRDLPPGIETEYADEIDGWRSFFPDAAPSIPNVVVSDLDFSRWIGSGCPPALLKLHGSVGGDDENLELQAPVVEDDVELAQLSEARLKALDKLVEFPRVLITGYSGADIDVYLPLLDRLRRKGGVVWSVLGFPTSKEHVRREISAAGVRVREGPSDPAHASSDGTARTNLREIVGVPQEFLWPQQGRGAKWTGRFDRWEALVSGRSLDFAEAFAWMLFDTQQFELSIEILENVRHKRARYHASTKVRLADAYYHRRNRLDRLRAAGISIGLVCRERRSSRALALIRLAGILRGSPTVTQFLLAPAGLALLHLAIKVAEADPDQEAGKPTAALAHSAVGHLELRLVETILASAGPRPWTIGAISALANSGIRHQHSSIQGSSGNRKTFATQQLIETQMFKALAQRELPPGDLGERLVRLRTSYKAMPDPRGVANCTAAIATLEMIRRNYESAEAGFEQAIKLYRTGDGTVDRSGFRLVERRRRILRKLVDRA